MICLILLVSSVCALSSAGESMTYDAPELTSRIRLIVVDGTTVKVKTSGTALLPCSAPAGTNSVQWIKPNSGNSVVLSAVGGQIVSTSSKLSFKSFTDFSAVLRDVSKEDAVIYACKYGNDETQYVDVEIDETATDYVTTDAINYYVPALIVFVCLLGVALTVYCADRAVKYYINTIFETFPFVV
ncbi:hypothetical protein [Singapore grouper iridovirus]|nr:hypothetical protein [Singapore grouper iridovirus]